jgi:DNA mismatch repair protein MLH3
MFGDRLTLDQCERLVARLAETRTPFVCAHGRPSLVPLIVLGDDPAMRERRQTGKRKVDWGCWRAR